MKSKYLDVHNCHELLPNTSVSEILSRLDECLDWINCKNQDFKGKIDKLIERNEKTLGCVIGAKRLCASPIEILQNAISFKGYINTQFVERKFPGHALYHTVLEHENGMRQKATIPLQFLLKGWGDASKGHQCYIHTISENIKAKSFEELFKRNLTDADTYYYVGITGRNWLKRLEEHIREMRLGNRRLFYVAWRARYGVNDVMFSSFLRDINLTYEDAMNWEEKTVDRIAHDQYGLNMISGGFKGLQELYKYRIIDNTNISLEEREMAISEFASRNPRKGLPNPFIAALWKDDSFYLKNIEAKEKTLSVDQVKKIRELHTNGFTIKQIVVEVNALNETQVRNVINGKTYSRVK